MSNLKQKPYYILGMDPGPKSCGFALLDTNNEVILEMGSHLFSDPVDKKNNVSLAKKRRGERSVRRNIQRTKNRQTHCLRLFKEYQLVPEDADKQWLQTAKGDKPPVQIRRKALEYVLSERELAQALYSLSGHRGYIPHGADPADKENDDGKVIAAVNENTALMKERGYRTVGEMFYFEGKSRNKKSRDDGYRHCVLHAQIEEEAKTIFETQRALGSAYASEEFEEKYLEVLNWEKKTLDHDERVYSLVGPCSYFRDEKRAANAALSSELCRAYERFGHTVIIQEDGTETVLGKETIAECIARLFSPVPLPNNKECKVRYSDLRKMLDLTAHASFKGIDAEKEKSEEVFAPKVWRTLRKRDIPASLLERMLQDHSLGNGVGEALAYASSKDSLTARLEMLDLADEEIEAICKLPFTSKVFNGYGSRSLKALELLLSAFEDADIRTLTQAEEATGLRQLRLADHGSRTKMLPPYQVYDPTCNNPVVLRAMGRMRRIVNAIIRRYGVPNEIHIELARDLKHSKREKMAIEKANRKNKATNKRLSELAAEIRRCTPEDIPHKVIKKLALYEEQGAKDAYTDEDLDIERLVMDDTYCQIDHILPYSRTGEDSRANKVLVTAKSNQDKGNRTPYEWMTQDDNAPDWNTFCANVIARVKYTKKKDFLLNTTLGEGDNEAKFLNRNLNDTRYMSRAVKSYLEDTLLFPEDGKKKHVLAVAGGATANLRRSWGLNANQADKKSRDDNRHHAVDACVIAACDESAIKRIADARKKGKKSFERSRKELLADTQPWVGFSKDVWNRWESIVPTRMANHGGTGSLFEDTLYRIVGWDERGRPLINQKGKTTPKSNYIINEDGALQAIDKVAFVRFWLDPTAEKKGKVSGKYYPEPVYLTDLLAISAGNHTARYITSKKPRNVWKEVPESATTKDPIVVRSGDVIRLGSFVGRFSSINIANQAMTIASLRTDEDFPTSSFPSLSKLGNDAPICIVEEDVLGHCYTEELIAQINKQEQAEG